MAKAHLSIEKLEDRLALSANYFISPTGSDSNTGTIDNPFATLQHGVNLAAAGDTISMLAGTYFPTDRTKIWGKDGTAANPIRIEAYQNAEVILNGANVPADPSNNNYGIHIAGSDYIEVDGLRITNMPNGGIWVSNGEHITLKNGESDHNGQKAGWNAGGISVYTGTSYVSIENWDAHHNRSALPAGNGSILGNSDGFSFNATGPGNQLINSRSWRNSDDGIDVYFSVQPVTISGNWIFENGYLDEDGLPTETPTGGPSAPSNFNGDGNGIKMGGGASGSQAANANHLVTNNVVWSNRHAGIGDNSHDGPLTVYNNTSYNNGGEVGGSSGYNFAFWDSDPSFTATVRNNLEYTTFSVGRNMNGADDQFNNWNLAVSVTAADFVSLDDSANRGPRQADGSLPVSYFLHLVASSDLLDKGSDVGLLFDGSSPDLGAFEFSVEPPSADFDGDDDIDGSDFLAWQRGLGTSNANKPDGDADHDQDVDSDDLGIWQNQFSVVAIGTTTANTLTSESDDTEYREEAAQAESSALSNDLVDLAVVSPFFLRKNLLANVGKRDGSNIDREIDVTIPLATAEALFFDEIAISNQELDRVLAQSSILTSEKAAATVFDELGKEFGTFLSENAGSYDK